MIRIAIILILSSLTNGYNHDKNLDLKELHASLLGVSLFMRERVMKDDTAIFFGNTKAGKSTLINYIINNELIGKRYSVYYPIEVIAKNESLGPKIGRGSLSETSMPSNWTSKLLPNLTLWDIPAFDDNRGPVRDITNSFYHYKLLKKVKSIKIVIVVDINDITQDNTQQFVSLIKSVENVFGNEFNKSFNSTTMIFTKVPKTTFDDQPIDKGYINYHLENNLLLDTGLKHFEDLKRFIRFLIDNGDRVALFKQVDTVGTVLDDIGDNIVSAIRDSECINSSSLQNIRPRISASSMLKLFHCQQISQAKLMINDTEKVMGNKLSAKHNHLENLNNESDRNEIIEIKKNLTDDVNMIDRSLMSKRNLTKKVESFITMDTELNVTVKQNLLKNVELIQTVENILNINISQSLMFTAESALLVLSLKYKGLISLADLKLGTISPGTYEGTMIKQTNLNQSITNITSLINDLNNATDKFFWDKMIDFINKCISQIKSWILSD